MNLLKKRRARSLSATVFALTLGAFLTLSVIAGPVAQALVTCTFSAGGVINVTSTATETTEFQVDSVTQQIWVNGVACVGPGGTALLTNTTAINLTGANLLDQEVIIDMFDTAGDLVDWGTINWTLSVGTEATVAPGDNLTIDASGSADGVDVALGASGIDLNNDADLDVTITGFDTYTILGSVDDDTINAAGSTATGAAFADDLTSVTGDAGDDTLSGGAGNDTIDGGASGATGDTVSGGLGDDILGGGAGASDAVDYSASVTAVTVLLPTPATGEGLDTLSGFEDVVGSPQGDNITGDGLPNRIKPGAGDDTVNGGAGVGDTYDVQDATDGVTVDLNAGTSTGGSGTDTLSGIENVDGGQGDDAINGDENDNVLEGNDGKDTLGGGAADGSQADGSDGDDTFDGGGGIDTVDYGDNTEGTDVDVDLVACTNGVAGELDCIVPDTIENAILGSGDDSFAGSEFNNIVWPNGGQNALLGDDGIDTLNYGIGYTAGVTINLSGGGASGGGQDSIGGFENAVGTAFNDKMFGTDVVLGTNGANLLVGGKGNDNISANAGPDFVRAGAGNDRVRGGSGDDTLFGQGGKDNIRGSGGADDINGGKGKDFCRGGSGNDFIKKCERPRHNGQGPNGPGLAARL